MDISTLPTKGSTYALAARTVRRSREAPDMAADRRLTFTFYPNCTATNGTPSTRTWGEWTDLLTTTIDRRSSKDGPAVILGHVPDGQRRAAKNVTHADALGIDLDKLDDDKIVAVLAHLQPFEHVAWTTFSHTNKAARLRVVVPFSAPVMPADFAHVWASLQQLIEGANDAATKDVSRLHYLPAAPEGAPFETWHNAGRFLDVTSDLPEPAARAATAPTISADDLVRRVVVVRGWLTSRTPRLGQVRAAAHAVAAGEPYAEMGHRHKTSLELTMVLARQFPDEPPEVIRELFRLSLNAMPGTDRERPVKQYEGALDVIADSADDDDAPQSDNPYSSDELQHIATAQNTTIEGLRKRWLVICRDSAAFLDESGTYSEFKIGDEREVAMAEILARAPVRLWDSTPVGRKLRAPKHVAIDHGTRVDSVVNSLVDQRTRFDFPNRALHLATCPRRPLVPRFDDDVDEWLRHLGGVNYPKLVDWLSVAPDLDKLVCAIYFDGAPGTGKTLFAQGVASIWSDGSPTDFEDLVHDFNDALTKCPLVLADEEIPKTARGQSTTSLIRSQVTTKTRRVNEKYKPTARLHGAIRLVITANNPDLLHSDRAGSREDFEALAQRFLYVETTHNAADFLVARGRDVLETWRRETIAAHSLYLHHNHVIKEPGRRLWVEGDLSKLTKVMSTRWGLNALVAQWLVGYTLKPSKIDSTKISDYVLRRDGRLLVNAQALVDQWSMYLPEQTKVEPSAAKIARALRAIARNTVRIANRRFYDIDPENLVEWANHTGIGSRAEILESIGKDTVNVDELGVPDEEWEEPR